MTRLVDLSHPLEDGMGAYPGLPPARIGAILDHDASRERYGGKAEFYLGRVEIAANTGTYLDAPFHRYRDGADLASLPLGAAAGLPGMVLDHDSTLERSIDLADAQLEAAAGRAVLVRTGWDGRWGADDYWTDGPFLTAEAAERLVASGVRLVGVDFANIDDVRDLARPVHTLLLASEIPIAENLRGLDDLPAAGFAFSAAPLAIRRGATVPVRAYAEVPS